jgi:hypothetical protein
MRTAPATLQRKAQCSILLQCFAHPLSLLRGQKTRRSYSRYLNLIENEFGDMTIEVIEHPKARGEFKAWRDKFANKPRTADYAWTVLARVLSVAKDRGKLAVNVCERGGRLYEADRAEKIWLAENIRQFCSIASAELQAALLLAL